MGSERDQVSFQKQTQCHVPQTPGNYGQASTGSSVIRFFFRSHHEKDGDSQVYSFVHYSCLGLAPNLERIDFDDISMATSGT